MVQMASSAETDVAEMTHNRNTYGADEKLPVQFYRRAIYNEVKSVGWTEMLRDGGTIDHPGEGRPIFDEVEYIKIYTPGDPTNIVDRQVNNLHRHRFAKQYAAFKQNQDQVVAAGTPVEVLAQTLPRILSLSEVETCKFLKIHTAEQLASCPDTTGLMGLQQIKQRVQRFLDTAKAEAPLVGLRAENEKLRLDMQALQAQMEKLAAGVPQTPATAGSVLADLQAGIEREKAKAAKR